MELIEYPNETKGKLGFIDMVIRKWLCNPFSDDGKKFFYFNPVNICFVDSKT